MPMGESDPANQRVWLWVSVGLLLAIISILAVLYRDALKHPTKRTRSQVVGTPS